MNENVLNILENALRCTRIPVDSIRSEREANQLIAWADSALQLAYASGEFELSCDVNEMKKTALEIRHGAKLYLENKRVSGIVASCNQLAEQLKVVCQELCPDLTVYLESRIKLGTY